MRDTSWLYQHLACPVDGSPLRHEGDELISPAGRRYPVIHGVPVLHRDDIPPQLDESELAFTRRALADYRAGRTPSIPSDTGQRDDGLHEAVRRLLASTNGWAYTTGEAQRMSDYPIPQIKLPAPAPGTRPLLLDIGCGWGRWSVAASRAGYLPVGLEPRLDIALAAQTVARDCGMEAAFVCADALAMPFVPGTFDVVWSYSVLQHFTQAALERTLDEIRRVLKPEGYLKTQMMNSGGIRSRKYLRERGPDYVPSPFDCPYYSVDQLNDIFSKHVGRCEVSVDQFFTQAQLTDLKIFSPSSKALVIIAHALSSVARPLPGTARLCDNVFVVARPVPAPR